MRAAAIACLVLFASCSEERRRDPVLKKFDSPVKLTVRKHEVRYKPPCEEKGLDVYKCWLMKPEKTGCIYLDVGEPFDDPAHENPCENSRENRLILSSSPAPLDFEYDPRGYRFAWRTGTVWMVGYLWDGKLLKPTTFHLANLAMEEPYPTKKSRLPPLGGLGLSGSGTAEVKSQTPIDWLALKSFDDAIPELYFQAPADAQEGMLARLRKLGGEGAVVKMLSEHFGIALPGWDLAFESLDQPEQKKVARAAEEMLFNDGNEDPIDWFDEHPELAPKDLEPRLAARAKDAIPRGDVEITQRWLTRGYRKHNPDVGTIACELLEAEDLISISGQGEGGYYDSTAYAVIAATHTKCPAVTRTVGTNPCDGMLRCSPAESEAETDYELAPLCTASDVDKVIRVLRDDDDPADDYEQAAKMGALLAQGPLPKAFVLADARRTYRLVQPDAGEDGAFPGLCSSDAAEVGRFLCQLRPEQTRFTSMGCKVEIDDEHKQVRFSLLDAPDAGR